MISVSERKFIIKAFGKHYSPAIIPHLNKLKLFNSLNDPFSPQAIQHLVGGHRENLPVEAAIIKFAATTLANKRKSELNRKALLKG